MTIQKETFTCPAAGGDILHGIWWLPEGEPRGLVQLVHGMAEHIDRYDPLARYLAERGYAVVGHDQAGHGESAPLKGYLGPRQGWQHLIQDIDNLRSKAQSRFPQAAYFLMGHSMGTFLVRCYLLQGRANPAGVLRPIAGVMLSGTGMQPMGLLRLGSFLAGAHCLLGGEKKPAWLLHAMSFGAYNGRYRKEGPMSWLSTDPESVAAYTASPLCGFPFTGGGYRDLFQGLKMLHDTAGYARIPKELPILLFSGDGDPVGDYGKAPVAVAELLKAHGIQQVTVKIYPGERHETLNGKQRSLVMDDLSAWMEGIIASK